MSGVNPQGVSVTASRCPPPRRWTTTSCGATTKALPRAGDDRHLQPLLLRGDAGRPRASGDPRAARSCPPAKKDRGHLDAALPRDQRLGALPRRQGLHDREAVPQPLEAGAAQAVPGAGSTSRRRTGSSAPPTSRSAATGTTTRRPSRTMLSRTSTEWAPWYVIPADNKWFARVAAAGDHRQRADRDGPAATRPCPTRRAMRCWPPGRSWWPRRPRAPRRPVRGRTWRHETEEGRKSKGGKKARKSRQEERKPRQETGESAIGDRQRQLATAAGAGAARRGTARRRRGTRSSPTTPSSSSASTRPKGLSAAKAAELLQKNGPNALPAEKPKPGWRRFLGEYRSYMQIILRHRRRRRRWPSASGARAPCCSSSPCSTPSSACARRARPRAP